MRKEQKIDLVIKWVPIEDLEPNDYNPNIHNPVSFDLLQKSMERFGFTQPILVHKQTMQVIDGEHRLRVASILNYEEIPVIFLDLTDTEMRYATILHNRARGTDDRELIDELYVELSKLGSDPEKELLMDRRKAR